MSSLAERTLAGETLARQLVDFRSVIVRKHHNLHRNHLCYEDVDDLYGRAIEVLLKKDPPAVFPNEHALRAWLDETMRRSILKYAQSAAVRHAKAAVPIDSTTDGSSDDLAARDAQAVGTIAPLASPDFTPEQHVLLDFEHDTIEEYIAGLSEADRRIALLYLWPSSRMTAKKIAATLELPLGQVQTSTQRISMSWQRYTAMSVGTVCRKQMKHLERWQRDGGPMPLQLAIHARRCANCRQLIFAARQRSYDALTPLLTVVGVSSAGGAGVLTKIAAGGHLVVRRVTHGVARVIPVGKQGAGSALLASKTATTAAVAVTAIAGAGATGGVVAVVTGTMPFEHHTAVVTTAPAAIQRTTTTPILNIPAAQRPAAGPNMATTKAATSTQSAAASPTGGAGGVTDRVPGTTARATASANTSSAAAANRRSVANTTTGTSTTSSTSASTTTEAPASAPEESRGEDSPTGKQSPAP